jgi:hypothetical protein
MNNDQLLQYLIQRVEKMDDKIDTLLKFKYQIIGGSIVLSVIASLITQVIFNGGH